MQKLKLFAKVYFFTFGLSVFMCAAAMQIKDPNSFSINLIWALALMLAVGNISCSFIFKTGVSKKSLWLRRAAVIGIMCVASPGSMILLNANSFEKISRLQFAAATAGGIVLLSIIAYIIADAVERKTIEKINKKLNENK